MALSSPSGSGARGGVEVVATGDELLGVARGLSEASAPGAAGLGQWLAGLLVRLALEGYSTGAWLARDESYALVKAWR